LNGLMMAMTSFMAPPGGLDRNDSTCTGRCTPAAYIIVKLPED
jgi:hypothetical protein